MLPQRFRRSRQTILVVSMADDLSTLEERLRQCQEELAIREAKIIKLKNLVKTSMHSYQRGEQQVQSLQMDIDDRTRHIQVLNQELEEKNSQISVQTEHLSHLELELTQLSNRLQSGSGSEAIQKRSERMKHMVEKSGQLYEQLQAQYQQVCAELNDEKRKKSRPAIPEKVIILPEDEAVTFFSNGTYEIGERAKHYPKGVIVSDFRNGKAQTTPKTGKQPPSGQSLPKAYLRGVLLEFLIADASTQIQLIPVILSLLDCSPEQISAAQRGFAEGKQIIAKAALALGL
jgi:hypothetical protein